MTRAKILAFDTSHTACSVALTDGQKVYLSHEIVPMQQTRLILPTIDKLLHDAHLSLKELDAIAYGCGPGSFTGIRIASSVAQGISFGSKLPVIRISSLAALAQSAYNKQQWSRIFVAVDARVQKIYWAVYTADQQGHVRLEGVETVCAPDKIVLATQQQGVGVGDGWEKYGESMTKHLGFSPLAIDAQQIPSADALLILAQEKFAKKEWSLPHEALPIYLSEFGGSVC